MHGTAREHADRIIGAMLVVAAIGKSWHPAAAGSSWIDLSAAGPTLRAVLLALEAALGFWLLAAPGGRRRHGAAVVVALAVAGSQSLLLLRGAGACGCFGSWEPPRVLTIALAMGAALAGVSALRRTAPPPRRNRWAWGAGALAVVAVVGVLARSAATESAGEALGRLLRDQAREGDWIVVGSPNCAKCERLIAGFRSRGTADGRVLVLFRRSEMRGPLPAGGSVSVRGIPDELWWDVVGVAPPAIYRFENARLRPVSDSRFATARRPVGGAGILVRWEPTFLHPPSGSPVSRKRGPYEGPDRWRGNHLR